MTTLRTLRRLSTAFLAAALGAAFAATAAADDVKPETATDAWFADFDKAVALAKSEKKDLLVDFTGSDWCGWCKKLHGEVFEKDAFVAAATKRYVLVALDYPHGDAAKAKVPNPARNDELLHKYGIQGYPTVLLMTPEGAVFATMGYEEGGVPNWLKSLGRVTTAREITAAAAKAKDPAEKTAVYERAIAELSGMTRESAGGIAIASVVGEAFGTESNDAGLRLRAAQALVKAGFSSGAVLAAAARLDPKNEAGFLEQALFVSTDGLYGLDDIKAAVRDVDALVAAGGAKDKKIAKALYFRAMKYVDSRMKDSAKAKAYAKRVEELGFTADEDTMKTQVERVLAAPDAR